MMARPTLHHLDRHAAGALAARLKQVGRATDAQLAAVVRDPVERGLALGALRHRGLQSDPPEGQAAEGLARVYYLPAPAPRPATPPQRRRGSRGMATVLGLLALCALLLCGLLYSLGGA